MLGKWQALSRWYGTLEKWVLVGLVLFLTGFSLFQIVLRNFFSMGIVWGDTLLRHIVLWVSLLGTARATAENKHIAIDILPRLLPGAGKTVLGLVTDLFSFLVSLLLCYESWVFVINEKGAGNFAFASVPYWWLEAIFPFGFAVMSLRYAHRLFFCLSSGRNGGETCKRS